MQEKREREVESHRENEREGFNEETRFRGSERDGGVKEE